MNGCTILYTCEYELKEEFERGSEYHVYESEEVSSDMSVDSPSTQALGVNQQIGQESANS